MIASSQVWSSIDSLKIIPNNPSTSDTVKIISYLQFAYSYCFHDSINITTTSFDIVIEDIHEIGNLPLSCFTVDTIVLGKFDIGNYCIVYNLRDTVNNLLDTDTLCFSILPSEIQSIDNNSIFSFFPNPIDEYATFSFLSFVNNSIYELELININGKRLLREIIRNNNYVFYRNQLPSGVYFFLIRKDEGILVRNKICLK